MRPIAVAGGGPAGMMAAIRASQLGCDVTLLEKNPSLGRKILLSGKGRCNLTNACELEPFLNRFSRNGQFLRDAFAKFFNLQLMEFFEERGVRLKVERQQRVFPATDRSTSIVKALESQLGKSKVTIRFKAALKDVLVKDGRVEGVRLQDGTILHAGALILATGGVSYAFTGSTGDGIDIARRTGHRIVSLRPGLVPLLVKQPYVKRLEGLALKNIRLRFSCGKKEIVSDIGELLFTGQGISGPLVLTLSGRIIDWLGENGHVAVEIDLKPALSQAQLEERLLREIKLGATKSVKNLLKTLLPLRLIEVFLECAGINEDKKANQITQPERKTMLAALKGFCLDIAGALPIEEAMVTRGGVSVKDINPRTMESRIIKGLYFAGEMLDIDADTGGFNLQAAFSTGYLAGESACRGT